MRNLNVAIIVVLGAACSASPSPNAPSVMTSAGAPGPATPAASTSAAVPIAPRLVDAGRCVDGSGPDGGNSAPTEEWLDPFSPATQFRRGARGKIACGEGFCTAGKEVCCDGASCVAIPPGKDREPGTPYGNCTNGIGCNESLSCGRNQVCCAMSANGGEETEVRCVPHAVGKRFACDRDEWCVPGIACRTPGAVCDKGVCRVPRPPRPIQCGKTKCAGATPVCCSESTAGLACTTLDACQARGGWTLTCTAATDCVAGESCMTGAGGAFCSHFDDGNGAAICNTAADCPASERETCARRHERITCAPSDVHGLGLRTCTCAAR